VPDQKKKADERITIIDRRTRVSVSRRRFGNKMIGRTYRVRTISAVHADATFGLPHSPLKRIDKETDDKEDEE
jgi:hypothetical protein